MDPDDEAADTSSSAPQQLQRPHPNTVAMTPEDGPAADPPPPAMDWPAMADAKPPQVPAANNYMTTSTTFDVVPNKLSSTSPSQVPSSSSATASSSLLVPGTTLRNVVETSQVPSSSSSRSQQQQVPNSPDAAANSNSSSDVENFTGKIVYNPDGSAFLLDDSESDSEPEQPPSQLATMVSALHVAASPALYSALYGHHLQQLHDSSRKAESATKVPEFPVVHSFRVFTVRDIADEDVPSSNSNKVPNTTTNSNTVAVSGMDYSSNKFPSSCSMDYSSSSTVFPSSTATSPAGRCSTGLLGAESASKPILMCFLCKLSFGYSKSFVSHAVGEHAIALNDEEKALMGVKGASAIIQGVGKDKTPTLSFLEPLAGPSPAVSHAVSVTQPPAAAMTTLVSSVSSPVPCPKPPTSSSSAPACEQDLAPEMQDLMTIERLARAAVAASRAAVSQQNGVLDTSRPSSRDSGATPPSSSSRRPSSPGVPCSCGGECPRCLGSSDPLMPMSSRAAMSHSRNSCKTLKCPKCNWHYKYQETLEIHMKEKHPENELSCAYCLTNQSHPRLARGETYTCGYKPYRCEVCNYSTTTKGNLSIHMQSDKHINNVQELQNGGGGAAMAPSATPPLGPTPPLVDPSPPSSKKPLPLGGPSPKPKATWRCDVCNYETNVARNLRIHMTSEKHNHNMMVLQQNVKHMQTLSAFQQMDPLFPFHPPGFLLPPPPPPPPPSCEGGQGQQVAPLQPEAALADMAYNHALLMMASQQQQHHEHQQHSQRAAAALALAAAQQAAVLSSKFSQQQQQQEFAPEEPPVVVRPDVPFDERHGRLFQCCVCHVFSCDTVEALSAHCQMDRTRQREEEVLMIVAGTYICKLCTYKTNLKANFQLHCKTDKHLQRLQHVNHVKEGGAATEWKLQFCASGLTSASVQVRCNACDHPTNSAHKLQLHASGPQHLAAARLFGWLAARQGGADCFFQCKGCGGFATKRKLAMIQHARSPRHARRCQGREDEELIVVRELTGNENIIFDADVDTPMLDLSDDIKMEDTKPSPPPASPASDSSRLKKALLTEPKAEPADNNGAQHRCPFCPFSCSGEVQLQMHVMSQHAVPCPLCQEGCRGTEALEEHLIQVHNVIKEGVQRLLLMVDLATDAATSTKSSSKSSPSPSTTPKEEGTSPSLPKTQQPPTTQEEPLEESKPQQQQQVVLNDEDMSCTFCNKGFSTPEELFSHQSEHGHMELRPTPTGLEYQCWWRRGQCDRTFRTPTAAQTHFKEAHLDCAAVKTAQSQGQSHNQLLREAQDCTLKGSQQNQVAVSDRHVYRYRCNQCSLAFKTLEKLQLHSQYHLIRAATKCPLCGRSFRSVVALQKHVEASHADMSREQMERYQSSLATNPLLSAGGPLGGVLDPSTTELLRKESARAGEIEEDLLMMDMDGVESDSGSNQQQHQDVLEDYINSQSMAEDSYNDPNRKYKCHRCKVAFTRQSYLTSHNKTLLHRKGEKMSYPMEKYLDPNRPFKCDVCLESFTQKNILLVHYNSVSHLHKVKLSMKETSSTATAPRSSSPVPSPTSSTPPTTEEKKPFKCNICKVSYTQGSTLDIHVRSVLHQTRASKLHELAASGQIDLTAPLIERAPETPSTPDAIIDSSSTTVPSENVPHTTAAAPSSDPPVPSASTSPAPPNVPTSQQQSNNTSLTPTPSAAAMMTLPSLSPAESLLLQQPILPELMTQQQLLRPRCPFPRPRPLVYKRLVESFGFDVVMHFNENNHRRKKIKTEEPENNEVQPKNEESATELPDSTTSPDLPEINKSVCDLCSKEFSCIWVLKTHREEIHKEMVPFDFLLKFSETYRVLYDKQSNDSSSALVVTPDDLDPPSTPSSEISPTPSSVASSNQPIPTPPTVVPQPPVESAASVTANQMAQLQFNQLLMSMGLGLGGPMGVNFMPPPLIPVLLPPPMDHPLMAFNHPAAMMGDPGSYFAAAAAAAAAAQQQQQQKLLQQQQQSVAAQQQKRARTRINDEQLKILRAYFDINNSPSEEQLVEMSEKSGLPLKVIKHWFRNTLFKERQRNKDSPYNFNNPPSTFLNLEEYEKTGEAKVVPLHNINNSSYADSTNQSEDPEEDTEDSCIEHHEKIDKITDHSTKNKNPPKDEPLYNHHIRSESSSPPSSTNLNFGSPTSDSSQRGGASFASPSHSHPQTTTTTTSSSNNPLSSNNGGVVNTSSPSLMFPLSLATGNSPSYVGGIGSGSTASVTSPSYTVSMSTNSPSFGVGVTSGNNASNPSPSLSGNNNPTNLSMNSPSYGMGVSSGNVGGTSCNQSYSNNNPSPSYGNPSASSPSYGMGGANNSPSYVSSSPSPYGGSGGNQSSYSGGGASGSSSGGKRANRTRFTDYQIKVLQEFFESNAYPKDDDLEYLSKLLSLSPRVIVVWFQNARQKARKVYENRPPPDVTDHVTADDDNSKTSTGNLNYQCKKCLQSFQRYYELIKHQKNACFKDENPLALMQLNNKVVDAEKQPQQQQQNSNGTYRCDKCSLSFSRFDQWREHQIVHIMNPGIFPAQHFAANSSFGILQFEAQQPPTPPLAGTPTSALATPPLKRKASEEEELQHNKVMGGGAMNDDSSQPKDKRLRTTILPEQLDYLYQKYQVESNPSRKMLENIAREVGLKKRVVQVWFQNTRARERKGQFRAHQQVIHKRCPFCRALFKARSALESHLATRHADQYTRGDINIDSLPDGEMDSNPETPTSSSEDCKSLYTGAGLANALGSQGSMGTTSQPDLNTMKKYYEDSLKKYLDDLSFLPSTPKEQQPESSKQLNSGPLDLSKPQPPTTRVPSLDEKSNHSIQDDAKSETYSESTMDLTDEGMVSSDPASPSGSSHHHGQSQQGMGGAKRFRTQMSTVQLKVMKSVFADYKTPSMAECETLGREIGLPKRVVQVWFQNARAKEKKARLAFLKAFGHEMDPPKPPEECTVCKVKYNSKFSSTSMQDHLFSRRHLDALKAHITKMKKLTEGQQSQQHDQDADEDPPSLMQQLHMMGLPAALPAAAPLPSPSSNNNNKEQEEKEPPQRKEDATAKEDSSAAPTTSEANNHLFPYMYGFPGYYAGLSGAFFHPGIFPGRNKL